MRNFKKSLIPLGVVVLGAVAAFASQGNKSTLLADEPGYITLDATRPCELRVACSDTGNIACTAFVNGIEHNAYGKWSASDVDCEKPLFQKMK